jgi:hypothetical protein
MATAAGVVTLLILVLGLAALIISRTLGDRFALVGSGAGNGRGSDGLRSVRVLAPPARTTPSSYKKSLVSWAVSLAAVGLVVLLGFVMGDWVWLVIAAYPVARVLYRRRP